MENAILLKLWAGDRLEELMKIYISGKITGLQKRDYRGKFKAAANRLRMLGHEVVDPSRI